MRAELRDFSGGITDFIFSSDITCCERLDNITISKDKSPEARYGSRVIDTAGSMPATIVDSPSVIADFRGNKVIIYGGQIMVWDGLSWTEVIGPVSANLCLTEGDATSQACYFEWNKHLFIADNAGSKTVKLFQDDVGDYKLLTAGLPAIASSPVITPSVNDSKSYIYAFHYYFEYLVGDVVHADYGPTIQVLVGSAADFSGSQNNISAIPVLTNTTATHYDLSNIKIKIFRSIDGGSDCHLIGTINNGTTTFTDNFSDSTISDNELVYTASGASDNTPPPIAKYIDISNNVAWYANVQGYPYRAYQSQIGDVDSVPEDYYLEFEEEIIGWSSFQSNPIAFTENQIWRIEGVIDVDGSGSQRKVMVTENLGCLNHASIVKTDSGLYFAGPDSFYWTDGYTVKKVPGNDERNIPVRYADFSLIGSSSIKGTFDRLNNRIYWVTKSSASSYGIYTYNINLDSLSGPWTGRSDSFKPTAILSSKDKKFYRTDESGHIFVHEVNLYSDPIIVPGVTPSDWQAYPVIPVVKHIAFDFGIDYNKWVTKLTVMGQGQTNLNILINSYDDSTVLPKQLVPIEHRSGLVWNDSGWIYGNSVDVWGLELRLNQTRYFKSGKIRCKRKQIEITSATATLTSSDADVLDSYVTVNSTAKTATVKDNLLVYMPDNAIGAFLKIDGLSYEVLGYDGEVFTLRDTKNTLINGDYEWSLNGYPDNQRLSISSIIYTFDTLDDKGGYYQRGVAINAD